ncbi:TPA: prenyltransferase/squalene oxidase repeat-containing protein [Klebsiella variicola subsp. variicola]
MDKEILDHLGEVSGETDLWCTYAAVRTYAWLGSIEKIKEPDSIINFLLSRQNSDGGYAWSVGMNSDAWATYYCTQAIKSLERSIAPSGEHCSCEKWLLNIQNPDGGFCMMPGQLSDVWATYYAVRTLVEVCGRYPDASFKNWLSQLQSADGGLTWSPAHSNYSTSDVRACYYAITAWMVGTNNDQNVPWNKEKLTSWLRSQQSMNGGFKFQSKDDTDCLWATFRATNALKLLDSSPVDTDKCINWIRGQLCQNSSFTRWPGYPIQDVWAAFCGIGSLKALNVNTDDIAENITSIIKEFKVPEGGFTYRELPLASDTLSTASKILSEHDNCKRNQQRIKWIEQCVMPNEDGIMYMPGRGSEVRCTLWSICAGAFKDSEEMKNRISTWLLESIQNPDGGFGYWEGRASDVISTTAAIETIYTIKPEKLKTIREKTLKFFNSCCTAEHLFSNVPNGKVSLRSTLQALRAMSRLGVSPDTDLVHNVLLKYRVKGGGFANEGNRFPDLLSTYEAVLTSDIFNISVDTEHLIKFINAIKLDNDTYSWTPLVKMNGGGIANCFGKNLDLRSVNLITSLPPVLIS